MYSYPDWGIWTFNPVSGSGLTPEAGIIIVNVTVLSPKVKNMFFLHNLYKTKTQNFTGNITIINKDNPNDKDVIPISMTTSKSKIFTFFNILYRFPLIEKILNQNKN